MSDYFNVADIFGENVFNDTVMQERLPKKVYKKLHEVMDEGKELDLETADVIAHEMKEWAIEKGATHYTHWFQPLTGITAEKHDAFVTHPDEYGKMIMEFSGKELIKGEPDASSFPSGGLRATFEARGYTAWDITSPAFLKEDATGVILCIPTAFCSYKGEALDKKTPLLRSMEAVSTQALRIVRLFGNTEATKVVASVGPEQEYFLVDRDKYLKREDLIFAGRTLFGAPAPKGQELEDHYFGTIRERIGSFMKDLNIELWKLGVTAKTQHNEVAPAQHELAPIFTTTNIAADHNQLTMEIMKKVALKHDLVCLLHEKPFAGVNGSGKHNNWSLSTNKGENLLKPGKSPYENAQFLLFLCSVIKAVDEYQDLLRTSVATAGNDHRLGANEAPPAIISMFLGDELTEILESLEAGTPYNKKDAPVMEIGVHVLPTFPKDTTDRNRTSPFAFTGNKFEFRMLGSSSSVSGPNIILNTIVAEELSQFADELEKAPDFKKALNELIRRTISEHKRIIFNGNNYSDEWVSEAERRGLLNLKSSAEALPYLVSEKNIALFTKHNIFTETEVRSRCDIMLDNYSKMISIEAHTMIDMAQKEILPASIKYAGQLCETAAAKRALSENIACSAEIELAQKISALTGALSDEIQALDKALLTLKEAQDVQEEALSCCRTVIPAMLNLRCTADQLETLVAEEYWPFPTYGELLFGV